MKITRQGRKYNYDYQNIIVQGSLHRSLKNLSQIEELPMGKMIQKLIENYESSSK